MNAFKKYIRKQGIKLESDYPYLPYNSIEAVVVDAQNACIRTYHNMAGWWFTQINRDGSRFETDIYTDIYKEET